LALDGFHDSQAGSGVSATDHHATPPSITRRTERIKLVGTIERFAATNRTDGDALDARLADELIETIRFFLAD